MTTPHPLCVDEAKAAKLFDMQLAKFRELVDAGHLPRGREIAPGLFRWPVEDLRLIAKGAAVDGMGPVEW